MDRGNGFSTTHTPLPGGEHLTRGETEDLGDLGNDEDDLDHDLLATARRVEKLLNTDDQDH